MTSQHGVEPPTSGCQPVAATTTQTRDPLMSFLDLHRNMRLEAKYLQKHDINLLSFEMFSKNVFKKCFQKQYALQSCVPLVS
jgi:hypothetical protein